MKLKRIEAGVYEHPSGEYRVERIDSLGEAADWRNPNEWVTTSVWVVTERPADEAGEWHEIVERDTKRECVEELEHIIRNAEAS